MSIRKHESIGNLLFGAALVAACDRHLLVLNKLFLPITLFWGFSRLRYATLLRDPIKRVVSEFFWGCGAKVNKRFTGEHEGKVLFDWPRPLWDSMGKSCLKGAPGSEFKKWLQGSGNPSHNRFIKMLANNTRAPPLRRKHNCAIGNEQATVEVC